MDLDNDYMTVQEFIELTKDSFGGQVIRKLAEVYDRKSAAMCSTSACRRERKLNKFREILYECMGG